MIETKYVFLVIIVSCLTFQYFKYKNVQNQKFVSFLSYFEELSMVNKETKEDVTFLVGFESIKYSIFKNFTLSDDEHIKKSICFSVIENLDDLKCALFKARKSDFTLKFYVKNDTLFKLILNNNDRIAHSQRLSGSGVNFARQLAYLKHTKVILASRLDKSSLKLIPNNIKVVSVIDSSKKLGFRKFGTIVHYGDNRKAIFDRAGLKTILDDLDLIDNALINDISPHCIVIGRFPFFRNDFIGRVSDSLEYFTHLLSSVPAGIIIHHQLGSMDNVEAGKFLIKRFIPHLDSIDLGLQELHQLHSLVRKGDFNTTEYTSDIETTLSILQDVWSILNSGSFSVRTGTRKISRIHLRAHDYHILLTNPENHMFYMNLKYALAKGLMAQLQARCNRKLSILREIVHFHLEDEFFMSNNLTESPIQCWSVVKMYDICVSPVPTCFELKHPLEDGESTAAAALAAQIKLPS